MEGEGRRRKERGKRNKAMGEERWGGRRVLKRGKKEERNRGR